MSNFIHWNFLPIWDHSQKYYGIGGSEDRGEGVERELTQFYNSWCNFIANDGHQAFLGSSSSWKSSSKLRTMQKVKWEETSW